ncbi:hypothetical protein PVL29_001643 [Vitis rotundifolia]|uniref:nucleoside-diphosphate kinase n=1 Tax=Vitis rotundifolia TaxID=103349 RepID=A0AA39AER3_VITRO|nr:hypothetical protein PVL29_001643 [Vitis rotundifolia]
MERTFIAIKPDGVQRGLIAEILSRFERKGFKLVAIKIVVPSKDFAQKHYHDLKERPFFNGLCDFLSSGPVVAMVWEGEGVIKYGRKLIGATDPQKSEPGTIRGDLAVVVGRYWTSHPDKLLSLFIASPYFQPCWVPKKCKGKKIERKVEGKKKKKKKSIYHLKLI